MTGFPPPHLCRMRDDMLELVAERDMTIHNNDKTFYREGSRQTFIDHRWSNVPDIVENVQTRTHNISYDHMHISCDLIVETERPPPGFFKTRPWKAISVDK